MKEFEITFLYDNRPYQADVHQADNIYTILTHDERLLQLFGEVIFLEANNDFAWRNPGPEFYQFALAIAVALKENLQSAKQA